MNAQVGAPASDEKAAALGAQLASAVRRTNTPLGLGGVSTYINKLGRQLVAQAHDIRANWSFAVIKNPDSQLMSLLLFQVAISSFPANLSLQLTQRLS